MIIEPQDDEPTPVPDDLSALADAVDDQAPLPSDHPMSRSFDAQGRVDIDQPCLGCGYNLRGQLPDGQCTECGLSVERSLQSDRLSFAAPQWVGGLRKGMNWVVIAIFSSICVTVLAILLSVVVEFANASNQLNTIHTSTTTTTSGGVTYTTTTSSSVSQGMFDPGPLWMRLTLGAMGITLSLMFLYAVWHLTQPEPDRLINAKSRKTTRWTIIPAYIISILATPFSIMSQVQAQMVSGAMQLIALLLLSVGFPASLLYLRHLARRVPDYGLAKQTTIVFWGQIVAGGVLIAGAIGGVIVTLMAVNSSSNAQQIVSAMTIVGFMFCPGILAVVVFLIWWIVLMCLYRGRFVSAHDASLRNHRHHRPGPYASPSAPA